jgi:ribosomal protein S7
MSGDATFIFLWLFFLFLPFFSKVKIGGFLELERKLEQAKQELQDFKSEIRNSMSVLSTNVNTIGGMTNQVTVNIPGLAELREARKIIDEKTPQNEKNVAAEVGERILQQSEDQTLALARTRIEIERLLRQIVGKRTDLPATRTDFLPLRQLFDLFASEHQDFAYLKRPFTYVTQVCNAAIHAQRVSEDQAKEALALGAEIIAVLRKIAADSGTAS